jgi:hypothetical protein
MFQDMNLIVVIVHSRQTGRGHDSRAMLTQHSAGAGLVLCKTERATSVHRAARRDVTSMMSPVRMRTHELMLVALLGLLGCGCSTWSPPRAAAPAPAAKAEAAAPAQTESTDTTDEGVMEKTRESVRSTTEWLARGVDSWFGDIPFEKGGRVTEGRLDLGVLRREAEGTSVSVRFNARLRLPNLEHRAYAFIGRDNQREVIADTPGALTRQQRLLEARPEDQSFFAGLGLPVSDKVDFRLGVRGGLRPYAQTRYRQPWHLSDRDRIEFRETVFWVLSERFGSTTALSYEHAVSATLGIRWLNAATITQATRNFEWSSVLGAYRSFRDERLLSLEALISGRPGTGVDVSDYGVQVKWEQRVYKDWLLGEVIVGHFWPRKDAASERVPSWAFGGNVKMRF